MNPNAKVMRAAALLAALLALAAAPAAHALSGQVVAKGLGQSLYVTAPAGDDRVFVVNKTGTISVLQGGSVLPTPFLDLSSRVATEGERGLLGLAFDPQYASNGRVYVDYIDATTHQTVVERYTVSASSPNAVTPGSGQVILKIDQPDFANHKGGWIGFRPGDSKNLYIATGDGGSGYDPFGNAQNRNVLLGKMLRVDVSGANGGYSIPAGNPFVGQSGTRPEIWALGLRNPWRNSFDRATGAFWIGDVGQDTREEIDHEAAADAGGHNYGWKVREGTRPTVAGNLNEGFTDPVFDYGHSGAGALGSSIIGGYVYRGPSIAGADGRYFFGDYSANRIYSFAVGAGDVLSDLRDDTGAFLGGTGLAGLDSFGEDGLGRLYAVGINGTVVVLVPESATGMLLGLGLVLGLGWRGLVRRRSARSPG